MARNNKYFEQTKKIVIAAWHLSDPNVGLGRYCRSVLDALGRIESDHRYEILVPHEQIAGRSRDRFRYRVVRLPVFRRRLWEQLAPLLASPYDLLHFPHDSSVIWKRGKFLVTIHDVKPLLFPSLQPRRNVKRWLSRQLVPDRCRQADRILTVSQCSRRDLIQHLQVPPERVSVVYQGVDVQAFRPLSLAERPSRSDEKFILSVAGGDPTKNLETLIRAFAALPVFLRHAYRLVLAGDLSGRRDLRKLVEQLGVGEAVVFTGIVSDQELVALYQRAAVFVFPSFYEGFGLPVLEAMACGCPVICSNTSSLPEVAGDAACLVDPRDHRTLAETIEYVLTTGHVGRRLREAGIARASQFTWERTAAELVAVYERTLAS